VTDLPRVFLVVPFASNEVSVFVLLLRVVCCSDGQSCVCVCEGVSGSSNKKKESRMM